MNKLLTAFTAALATITSRISAQSPLTTCGGDFQEVEAILYPSSILNENQDAYLYISYVAPYQITSGYIITSLNINGMPYPDSRSELCSKFRSIGDSAEPCPIMPGTHTSNISFPTPDIAGKYKLKTGWFTDTDVLLLCLKMLIEIVPHQQ
jgi:hypothetical protein